MVLMGDALRGRSPQNVDSDHVRTTLLGEGIVRGADIQRRRKELVSELRVFLVVRYAIDVNFMEIVERRSNAKNRETQLKQNEEKQRDQNGCNKCEDNFLNEMAPGDLRRLRLDSNGR